MEFSLVDGSYGNVRQFFFRGSYVNMPRCRWTHSHDGYTGWYDSSYQNIACSDNLGYWSMNDQISAIYVPPYSTLCLFPESWYQGTGGMPYGRWYGGSNGYWANLNGQYNDGWSSFHAFSYLVHNCERHPYAVQVCEHGWLGGECKSHANWLGNGWQDNLNNMRRRHLNDRISSAWVPGGFGLEFYSEAGFSSEGGRRRRRGCRLDGGRRRRGDRTNSIYYGSGTYGDVDCQDAWSSMKAHGP